MENEKYDLFNLPQRYCECCGRQISEMEYNHTMGLCYECFQEEQEEEDEYNNPK